MKKRLLGVLGILGAFSLVSLTGCNEQVNDENGHVFFTIDDAKLQTYNGKDYVAYVSIYRTDGSSSGAYYATEFIQYDNYFIVIGYATGNEATLTKGTYSNSVYGYRYYIENFEY